MCEVDWQTLVEQGAGGNLVATDQFGNQYYERSDTLSNRHRWVVYANAQDYRGQDPSGIPPEWHGWLHAITDSNPLNHQFVEPIYAVPATVSRTNTPQRHTPKGSWFHPEKRNWVKYQAWGRN
ncbi:hypothetical protein H632_c636p2 [Helicosporidium sp. ATCC 50920]|nr:hypothetical protein H632_c636p2 [Helicosporidium sp. ATCC 50920]|eukprot:KDD75531.1 hypothetical protein H632_c636p2 [Helicosporidium sp. ATCC 50920]